MKHAINVLALVFVGYPCLAVGYVVAAAVSGFRTGAYFYDKHEDAAIKRFVQ
jgi:hypothetical protein